MQSTVRVSLGQLLAASVLAAAAQVPPALAQTESQPAGARSGALEEVIVTAQKREENLQETPIAITALTSDAIERLGVTSFGDVAAISPALATAPYPSSSNSLFVFIRGQGIGDPAQITKDGSVGLYVDGLYISRAMATTFDLADIERIEVLRGPQGTLYGRNTTGGAVNIITKKPTGEWGFKEQLSFGNYDAYRSLTTLDLPAVGGLSAKLSFIASGRDGFVENIGPSNDYNESEERGGRIALHWDATDSFSADYAFEKGDADTTPIYYQNAANLDLIPGYNLDRFKTYRAIDLPESNSRYDQHSLTLSWDVSDALTIRSLTGYRDLEMFFFQDYNESFNFNAGTVDAPFLFPLGFQSDDDIDMDQFSQELQFVGSALDDRLTYTAGLYYFREKGTHDEVVSVQIPAFGIDDPGDNRHVEAESKSKAVYAQVTWTPPVLDDRLDLTVGARYTEDDRTATKQYVRSTCCIDPKTLTADFSKFNPAGTVSFRWTDDLMVYGKVATGYRAGGFSESSPDFERGFDPEEVTSYELGLKSDAFDGRLRTNLAVFQADYKDMQLDLSPDANDLSLTDTYNAGDATIDGVELDLTWAIIKGLTLTANYVHLHSDVDFIDASLSPILSAMYPDGNAAGAFALAFLPEDNYSVALDYVLDGIGASNGQFSAHVDAAHHDEFLGSTTSGPDVPNGDLYNNPARTLLNARLGYAFDFMSGRLTAALWGRNLADKDWYTHTIGSGDVRGYYGHAQARGEPRTYGLELIYQY
jgi:iron complex outermembrane receptor protein